jgi:hypothetical protein
MTLRYKLFNTPGNIDELIDKAQKLYGDAVFTIRLRNDTVLENDQKIPNGWTCGDVLRAGGKELAEARLIATPKSLDLSYGSPPEKFEKERSRTELLRQTRLEFVLMRDVKPFHMFFGETAEKYNLDVDWRKALAQAYNAGKYLEEKGIKVTINSRPVEDYNPDKTHFRMGYGRF